MKSRIYLAALLMCLSCAAQAQSKVTLYGVLDTGVEYLTNSGTSHRSAIRMESNNDWGSRFGLMGTENLGGGWKALFQLEGGMIIGNGNLTMGGREFGRIAMVGIENQHHKLVMGRLLSPLIDSVNVLDPTIYAQFSLATQDPGLVSRGDNAIRYFYTQGPFQFSVFYSLGTDTLATPIGQPAGAAANAKDLALAAKYNRNGLLISAVYDHIHGPLATAPYALGVIAPALQPKSSSTADRVSRYVIGARYKLRKTTMFYGWRYLHAKVLSRSQNSNLVWGGVSQEITPFYTLVAAVYHQNVAGIDAKPTSFVLANYYYLSKRTVLYLNGSYMLNTSKSDLGVDTNAQTSIGTNQFGVQLGMTHFF